MGLPQPTPKENLCLYSSPSALPGTGEIWAGRPAKLLRKLEEGEAAFITRSAANYAVLSRDHAIENAKTFPEVRLQPRRFCNISGHVC